MTKNQDPITEFQGEFRFLSNFYPAPFVWDEKLYPTAEHMYQSMKALNESQSEEIRLAATPGEAKRKARKVDVREDWDAVKFTVMMAAVGEKFKQNPALAQALKETGDRELQEGNRWGDTFWGVDLKSGQGENWLGRILMEYRSLLIEPL